MKKKIESDRNIGFTLKAVSSKRKNFFLQQQKKG